MSEDNEWMCPKCGTAYEVLGEPGLDEDGPLCPMCHVWTVRPGDENG